MFARSAAVAALLILVGATIPAARQPPAAQPAASPPAGTPALSPRNASYAITARLDPKSRTLTGDEILTWRNTSNIAATRLRFHLYYNAWRNTSSTWMRERRLAGDTPLTSRPCAKRTTWFRH